MTETPPSRSRPRRGVVPANRETASAPTINRETSSEAMSGLRFTTGPGGSAEVVAVGGHAELAPEGAGRAAAHDHAVEEDLEVLDDAGPFRVQLELERDGGRIGVDAQEAVRDGV